MLIIERLKKRPDTEHEQALFRVIITSIVFFYLWLTSQHLGAVVSLTYLLASILFLGYIFLTTKISPIRRIISITSDICVLTFALFFANESGALLMATYLWIITGSGFRYGIKYLIWATIITIMSQLFLFLFNDYWRMHEAVAFGWLIVTLVIPIFMASLIQRLHRAIAHSEEANQAKSQFLANMSHELRTPLNGIIGAGNLLTMTSLNDEQKKYTNLIQSSGHTLLGLIEDVLDISKIEAGKLTSELKNFDLHDVVSSTTQNFQLQAEKKSLLLNHYVDPVVPFRLYGDELHLRQILMNFLSNAIKFTEQGGVDLIVEPSEKTSADKVWIHFKVIDTGIGLSSSAQQSIFESFVQADASVTRKYGGTGLGTTISKELVEAMGGTIGVESEEGVGSTFWFTLPFQRQPTIPKEDIAATSFANVRVLTLLSRSISPIVQAPLKRWGQETVSASSMPGLFADLIEATNQNKPFHIAIVEKEMLGMTGQQFIKYVRAEEKLTHVSFIIVGADFDKQETASLIHSGYISLLSTPLNESILFNAIHEVCIGQQLSIDVLRVDDYQHKKNQLYGLRILIAEDNEINQIVIREFLERMGHHVEMVVDGDEALDALSERREEFDIAILDMNMPNLSGLEVLKAYRFIEAEGHLPIVMLSADAQSSNIEICLESGADYYLTKPVDQKKITTTLNHLALNIADNKTETEEYFDNTDSQKTVWQYIDITPLEKLQSISSRERFIENLITKFLHGVDEKIIVLEQAKEKNDTMTFLDIIHTLKGSSGVVGATAICATCATIEQSPLTEQSMAENTFKIKKVTDDSAVEFQKYIKQCSYK